MLVNTTSYNDMDTGEQVESPQDALTMQLIRRSMLNARVPSTEWASVESTLLKFSSSLLNSSIKGSFEYDESKLAEAMKRTLTSAGDLEGAKRLSHAISEFQKSVQCGPAMLPLTPYRVTTAGSGRLCSSC